MNIKDNKQFQKAALQNLVNETVQTKEPTVADQFLPDEDTQSTEFAYDILKKSKYIAAMIGVGSEPPVVDRNAVASMHGELAKLGLKDVITEEELLVMNDARSDGEKQAMTDQLYLKGFDLVDAIQRRVDVTKMEVLTKGTFNYDQNGVKVNVDFLIPDENKITLPEEDDWSNPERDVIGDLMEWIRAFEDANGGVTPGVILMPQEIHRLLFTNQTIVTEARGANSGTNRVTLDQLNDVFERYNLPPIEVIKERKVTVKNVYTGENEVIEYFPANRIVMLSEGIGSYLYGPTLENDFEPGISLELTEKRSPNQVILQAVAAGFPKVERPERIFHADVINPQ